MSPDKTLQPKTARLRLRVSMAAESSIRKGHPWLFADSIRDQNRPGKTGETAVIYDRQNKFLALGLFDADSPIRVRLLIAGKPQDLNSAWWQRRLSDALQRREGLFDDQTTAYRCINGESDGWPALVLDRYGSNLVLKLYSAIWLPRIQEIASLLVKELGPERVVLRLSRNIQQVAGSTFSLVDGQVLSGPALKSANVSFDRSFPLASSEPTFIKPIVGCSRWRMCLAKIDPMTP